MMIGTLSAQGSSFSIAMRLHRRARISQRSRYLRNRATKKFLLSLSAASLRRVTWVACFKSLGLTALIVALVTLWGGSGV